MPSYIHYKLHWNSLFSQLLYFDVVCSRTNKSEIILEDIKVMQANLS